ncbi:UDP-N-acetylmuramoyl-tripeptide--D-alanyl-D-alanine ligase [Alloalcanivorax marinus]|uniref:UDP-N-acetylmuramoyl-tripeptide--D-alanyl-D- alanine ligase n=1 Tax=Alloalcanivorax marinus TaxID=1177169 RepID=UPI0021D11C6D|nr:UDP-N-acetylmuramoyl-tripeptide--D-alanyl-D-alanine ligase [Alloalcanivorax marinus]MCU5786178.1 UDP-N-acetylmuramoyl-tripeptide--D-alanyl-D-alan ine ligase [Alloalcanivorax marinus]
MMRLSDIRDWTGGELRGDDLDISAVSTDTRALVDGSLFVALRGDRFDGHDFLEQALAAGARAVVVERDQDLFDRQVRVADGRQALGRIAAGQAARFPIPRVAVTGNAGKTTVKEMTAVLLGEGTLATRGNLNNDIGVPLTLLRLGPEHRRAVIELGANAPGEIAWTVSLVKPQVALITNVTGAHLEGFGSMDGIARAKAEIFTGCAEGATAIVNNDDHYADFFAERATEQGLRVRRVGVRNPTGCDLYAESVRLDEQGADFLLQPLGLNVRLPLVGAHQVGNALLALAAVQALGEDLAKVVPRLEQLKPVPGRMNVLTVEGGTLVDDTYNANPGSVRAAIAWLAQRSAPRALVLGPIGELGPDAEKLIGELGEDARLAGLDTLITVPGAESAARGFGDGARPVDNHDQAAREAKAILAAGGTVLVKGSRFARMEQVVQRLTNTEGGQH